MSANKRIKSIHYLMVLFALAATSCATTNRPKPPKGTSETSIVNPSSTTSSSEYVPAKNNNYTNPCWPLVNGVKKNTYMADPYVIRDGEDFYLYCTQTNAADDDGIDRFRAGPIFKSNDMVSWKYVGDVFNGEKPTWGTSGAGVWAPTVIKVKDKWIYYYSLSTGGDANPGIGLSYSATPYGPWTHVGKLFDSNEIGVTNSIDPHVFYDDNRLFMVFGSYGGYIHIVELNEDGLGLKGGVETQAREKVKIAGLGGEGSENYEGSFIFKRNNKYYLLLSTGNYDNTKSIATYHVVCGMADELKGPYYYANDKSKNMFGRNKGDLVVNISMDNVLGTGHCCVMTDDKGEYWMIYHGYDMTGEHKNDRVIYLDRLLFDDNGIVSVKDHIASNHTELAGPYLEWKENVDA